MSLKPSDLFTAFKTKEMKEGNFYDSEGSGWPSHYLMSESWLQESLVVKPKHIQTCWCVDEIREIRMSRLMYECPQFVTHAKITSGSMSHAGEPLPGGLETFNAETFEKDVDNYHSDLLQHYARRLHDPATRDFTVSHTLQRIIAVEETNLSEDGLLNLKQSHPDTSWLRGEISYRSEIKPESVGKHHGNKVLGTSSINDIQIKIKACFFTYLCVQVL